MKLKIKWVALILIVCLVFVPTSFACSGDKNDSDNRNSTSSDSSSSSSNSGSDKSSGVSSGGDDGGNRNGYPRDCDPYGVVGPLCPKETESGVNND